MDGSPHASTASEVEATTLNLESEQESALDELEAKGWIAQRAGWVERLGRADS
jgi:hypothetical protein